MALALTACRPTTVTPTPIEPLVVPAGPLSFDDTFVGYPTALLVPITSPGRTARTVSVSTSGPFGTDSTLVVPGGETASLEVRFAPLAPGPVTGTLTLGDEATGQSFEIALEGLGLAVPDCSTTAACVSRRFELAARGCVDTPLPDGTRCQSELGCFASAACVGGECRGTAVTCDDGNLCTLDVCSEVGCGQVDMVPFCPTSPNPCLVPSCSVDAGCGFTELPDGTACGERTCTTALICLSGACVQRTPPRSQTCADLLVGVPAGLGFVDGRGSDVRFTTIRSLAVQGNDLMVLDGVRVRRVRGESVSTIAGSASSTGIIDGIGPAASVGTASLSSLASTRTPGLFFLGDGTTVRLVSTQGVVTTLAGRADAGGALDGVGGAARLSLGSRLTPGGAGARFVQVPDDSTRGTMMQVREVGLTGAVRTLQTFDLSTLPGYDGGGPWDFWSAGVAESPGLTAFLTLRPFNLMPPLSYVITWTDGGSRVAPGGPEIRWSDGARSIEKQDCGLVFRGDGGPIFARLPWCSDSTAFDQDGGVFVSARESVAYLTAGASRTVAGPVPDRRVLDGDRDAGRLVWPKELSVAPEGVFVLDSDGPASSGSLLRLARLAGANTSLRATLETFDAGVRFQSGMTVHQNEVWLADQDGWVTRVDRVTGARVSRERYLALAGLPRLASNGTDVRAANHSVLALELDGGARRVSDLAGVQALAAAPQGPWYAFGYLEGDGGAPSQARLYRLEADDSVVAVAGDPSVLTDTDGPALQAGLRTVWNLTVAPDGTPYFLVGNRLKHLRNGQIATLIEFADTPLDLVALPDGTLVVSVDAALLRVFP